MAKLLYQGHGSHRLQTADGTVIYIDPHAGTGYDVPADCILVSHDHYDHNAVDLIQTQKPGCRTITYQEALAGGEYRTFTVGGVEIEAVEAYNQNHDRTSSVGFVIRADGVSAYFSCDTSETEQMHTFAGRGLDYAFLCCDGVYNMDLDEAARCARIIGARHNVPVHMKPGELFDRARAEAFDAPNRLIIEPGQEIEL